jgi:hypothetical protein
MKFLFQVLKLGALMFPQILTLGLLLGMNHPLLCQLTALRVLNGIRLHSEWRCSVTVKVPISVQLVELGFITQGSGAW